ncbi:MULTISPECIES: tyrosine-type recombinase/integrase [unclassified Sphingobium]|uniref:tyrosine-type recombinase/integrase n=1 Tax=unclassified Sphingobium TaxID=2611147 RepID=UPI002224EE56|nr:MULTISPECIES: site-specific integrase [unclassified Sphingobium]MCW2410805.1 integrase [Sphingobium sp. B8D3D]MCW2416905.1 integrase [Sphingobium sp. B8D3A]
MLNMVYGNEGQRKYLTQEERAAVLAYAAREAPETYTFCMVLAVTGCRISEALALTLRSIDLRSQCIIIESLKKRKRGIYRAVPAPLELVKLIHKVHGRGRGADDSLLWTWSRMTAWRKVNAIMQAVGIKGMQATAKGFRHGFGVSAIHSGVPLNMVQKWMGHTDISTTAIYTGAVGREELEIASRMWGSRPRQRSRRQIGLKGVTGTLGSAWQS